MYPGLSLWLVLSLLATTQAANNPEVSWGDWLVMDEAEPGTSILLRRITPKSVFVAPSFCSEGYTQDSMGRCVKVVKVNHKAQWDFFLERINSMYATSSTSKKPQKEGGPFHINLPIGSDGSQEDGIVRKRVPPIVRDDIRKPIVRVQTTTALPTTTAPQEATTMALTTAPTTIDCSEITTTEKGTTFYPESTMEPKRVATTGEILDVMMADLPATTELSRVNAPKIQKEINSSTVPEKPFVIIVTNEPRTSPQPTTTQYIPTTTEEVVSETPTEFSTEGTTDSVTARTTDYDGSVSKTKEPVDTSIRPNVKDLPFTFRPNCDPLGSHILDSSDCAQSTHSTERSYDTTKVASVQFPPSDSFEELSESKTPVRFPSELAVVPVRKSQAYVRFPGVTNPHDDRPSFWWPSWQVRQHPGVQGWPASDITSSEQALRHRYQYPPYPQYSWVDSSDWRRRIFQRD